MNNKDFIFKLKQIYLPLFSKQLGADALEEMGERCRGHLVMHCSKIYQRNNKQAQSPHSMKSRLTLDGFRIFNDETKFEEWQDLLRRAGIQDQYCLYTTEFKNVTYYICFKKA